MTEALEQAIADDPSDRGNWAVYADYLLGVEPALGERVALGLAYADAAAADERERLRAQIDALERRQARAWFGRRLGQELAPVIRELEYEGVIELDRRFGMIVGATLREPKRDGLDVGVLLRALLDSPLARVLARLHVQADANGFMVVVNSIIERRLPRLRRVTLFLRGVIPHYPSVTPPRAQTLLDRMPGLVKLELHGNLRGRASHAALRELKLVRSGHSHNWPFAGWRLPALEVLHVEGGDAIDWTAVTLPRLRRLVIHDGAHATIDTLARAPTLAQLDSLVLADSRLVNADADELLAHRDRFAAIAELAVLGMHVDAPRRAALQRALPHAILRGLSFAEQREARERGVDLAAIHREQWLERVRLARF